MKRASSMVALSLLAIPMLGGLLAATTARAASATSPGSREIVWPSVVSAKDAQVASAVDEVAVFAGGCFWGIEAVFEHLDGVKFAESGYAGGDAASARYDQVSSGRTRHAEAVRVVYDPSRITYEQLLSVFFSVAHDPTQLNRQGPDVGSQYRSAIFFGSEEQRAAAQAHVAQLTEGKAFKRAIVTEIVPLEQFHAAEKYHQDYMARNPHAPYIVIHDAPKVANLKRQFPALYRERAR